MASSMPMEESSSREGAHDAHAMRSLCGRVDGIEPERARSARVGSEVESIWTSNSWSACRASNAPERLSMPSMCISRPTPPSIIFHRWRGRHSRHSRSSFRERGRHDRHGAALDWQCVGNQWHVTVLQRQMPRLGAHLSLVLSSAASGRSSHNARDALGCYGHTR
jgi:hypothetical protein